MLAFGLLLATEPASASAAPSSVVLFGVGPFGPGGEVAALGIVSSPNRRCLGNRTIEVRLVKPEGAVLLDVARSGRNGGWHARGPKGAIDDVTAVKVKLVKRKSGSGAGGLRCGGDEFVLS